MISKLITEAEEAITNVFSDQSVSQSETAEALKELKEFIDDMLNSLTED